MPPHIGCHAADAHLRKPLRHPAYSLVKSNGRLAGFTPVASTVPLACFAGGLLPPPRRSRPFPSFQKGEPWPFISPKFLALISGAQTVARPPTFLSQGNGTPSLTRGTSGRPLAYVQARFTYSSLVKIVGGRRRFCYYRSPPHIRLLYAATGPRHQYSSTESNVVNKNLFHASSSTVMPCFRSQAATKCRWQNWLGAS
jgi:hypothetical protein